MASHRRRIPSITRSTFRICQLFIIGECLALALRRLSIVDPTPPVYLELLLEILKYESWKTYRAARWPWRRIIAVIYLRATHGLSVNVARRDVQPTTAEAISSTCSKRLLRWMPHVVHCGQWPYATLHEIGSYSHSQGLVLLYFHGGGYVSPLHKATHMPLILKIGEALHGGSGKTFVLEYGLAPGLRYPGQLVQSVCALNYLLTELSYKLDQIVIAGDGSGGNLALALLVHIAQPHPIVPKIVGYPRCDALKGALLISPWVSLTYAAASYEVNTRKDYLDHRSLRECVRLWDPDQERWSDFVGTPTCVLGPLRVYRALLTVGGFEVFRDDVQRLTEKMEASAHKNSSIVGLEFDDEVHLQPAVDAALGLPMCKSLLEILLWCRCLRDGENYYLGMTP
jgi:acetyl esterase/lipase